MERRTGKKAIKSSSGGKRDDPIPSHTISRDCTNQGKNSKDLLSALRCHPGGDIQSLPRPNSAFIGNNLHNESLRKKYPQILNPLPNGNGDGSLSNAPTYIRTEIDGKVEVIPEEELRYCICNDVSYGRMITCDHGIPRDGCQEWFHMGCVGLHDMPGRTVKWYCPNCRVKLHKGESSNGLVITNAHPDMRLWGHLKQ